MSEDFFVKCIHSTLGICKWLVLQIFLYFLMPYLWNYEYATGTIVLMCLYTSFYVIYWNLVDRAKRAQWILSPYLLYLVTAIILCLKTDYLTPSVWFVIFLPLYGFICFLCVKLFRKYSRRIRKRLKHGRAIANTILIVFLLTLKFLSVIWVCQEHKSLDSEKSDILERRNYLVGEIVTTPEDVLNEMPKAIGAQFQGEWALYSCSMLSASLVNISKLYPETKKENISYIDSLISIVLSYEIRYYDIMRWNEDPLESLDSENSHVSYLSHLAWMICGYKEIGGENKYDALLTDVCEAMNRRLVASDGFNLPTYPGEAIYVPDMLVAIVALNKYADMNNGKYHSTVRKWINKAQTEWIDNETGLLVSFLDNDGYQFEDAPVKGSYSALNCYYLSLIDKEFAKSQYEQLKSLFWKVGTIAGLKEYWDNTCYIGLDIDAGPILFELSPSGTAFFTGSATFFGDTSTRKKLLRTAEAAGHTIKIGNKRHYLLANIALVGESIMLAMRTNCNTD